MFQEREVFLIGIIRLPPGQVSAPKANLSLLPRDQFLRTNPAEKIRGLPQFHASSFPRLDRRQGLGHVELQERFGVRSSAAGLVHTRRFRRELRGPQDLGVYTLELREHEDRMKEPGLAALLHPLDRVE